MLKRIDRMVLAEVITPFVGSAALFTGLFLAGGEFVRFAEYLQSGESVALIGQLFLLTLPGVVALTFPMAMLLAALLGFGRMSGDSEVIAMTAAGVSFERIVVPVGLFALMLTGVGVYFNDTIVPLSNRQREQIIADVKEKGGISVKSRQAFSYPYRKGDTLTFVVVEGGIEAGGPGGAPGLRDVSVTLWKSGRVTETFWASRASWTPGTNNWQLSSDFWGASYDPDPESGSGRILSGSSGLTKQIELGKPEQVEVLRYKVEEQTNAQLRERSRILREGGDIAGARAADVEIARRVAIPFGTLVFALIGSPLGVGRQRTGKGVGFGYSVIITFCYWMLLQFASILGRGGVLPAGVAVMLPNLLGLGIAMYLIRRVLR